MSNIPRRAALYLRVSTQDQTTENQRRELAAVAERAGWLIVETYEDAGISGAKGRDKRPAFNQLLKDAARRRFDLVAAWSVDRLGRSLQDLVHFLEDIHGYGIDLYLHQQGLDTSTPAGRAMFQMLGVFSEFERALIRERIAAGLARARAEGKTLGRPKSSADIEAAIRASLAAGTGVLKTARTVGVGTSVVQRVKAGMVQDPAASPYERYCLRFQKAPPLMQMDGLDEGEQDALMLAAITSGQPLDPDELMAWLPEGAVQ